MIARLRVFWLGAGSVPLLLALWPGPGRLALTATALWVVGFGLLALVRARDPDGVALATLRTSAGGPLLAVAALIFAAGAALLLPGSWVLVGALAGAVGILALWAWSGPSPRLATTARRLGVIGIACAGILAVGEIFFRIPAVVARTGGYRPGIVRWEAAHYDRLWQRNPLRMRSFHLDAPKPPGSFQILALGDDATFGGLIANTADTWPYVLEADFARDGRPVQVIDAGQNGFTTANEAEWLTRVGFRFEPDLLIVQFSLNDAVPSRPDFGAERSFWYFDLRPLLPGLHGYLEAESYLYSALDSIKEHQEMRHLHPEGYTPLYRQDSVGWRQSREAMREIGAWARERGIPALLVIFPDLEFDTVLTPGRYRYAAVHDQVRRAAEAAGLGVLDLFPVFAAKGASPEVWYPLPCEPLPGLEAQRLAGDAVYAEVARRLPPRAR